MENNEVMVMDEIIDETVVADGGKSLGTGTAILIGLGVAAAIGAGVALSKKVGAWIRAKKELRKPDREVEVDDEDLENVVAK